ncbi:MAG: ABC transporter ATP-binding protein [Bacteroidota bacterium]
MLMVSLLEFIGVASILPFMQLISEPDVINQNEWLRWAFDILAFESHRSMLISTGVLVIVLLTCSNLFSIATLWLQQLYSWQIAHNLSIRLLNNYLKKPYTYFLNTNTAELRAYLISEVGSLTGGVLIPTLQLISRTMIAIVIFTLLLIVNPQIATIMLLTLGGAYGIIYLSRQRVLKRLGQERIEANMSRYRSLEEMLTGIKTIRVYGVERHFYDRYEKASDVFCSLQPRVRLIMASPRYILEILAFGGILGVTLYLYITSGNMKSTLPILTLYAVAGYRLLPALQKAFSAATKLRHNYPILDKLYDDLLLGLDSEAPRSQAIKALPFEREIRLENISYQYENTAQKVLKNLNLTIPKGEVVAFVGATGSGKTTLIDLIVGLHTTNEGKVRVDDVVLNPKNVYNWQENLAYVPQEVFLFDDSLLRNIVIDSNENIDHQRLEAVTRLADIYEFIVNDLPEGFATPIGERGVRLSGGQRQRLGLARALYRQPKVLILDEATSALDSITEKGIIEALKKLPEELTVLIIAHRLSTVRHANCIYLLQEGQIVETGNYDHLFQSSDVFRTMVELS